LFAHDLFGKPLHTFPDHALGRACLRTVQQDEIDSSIKNAIRLSPDHAESSFEHRRRICRATDGRLANTGDVACGN
jgi:hypothetical protein